MQLVDNEANKARTPAKGIPVGEVGSTPDSHTSLLSLKIESTL